jgi:hypothetical protein
MPVLSGLATPEERPIITLLVRPTEARAEALRAQGREPKMIEARVLIDTGATDTCIQRSVADELDLDVVGEVDVHGVSQGVRPERGIVFRARFFHAGVPSVALSNSSRVIAVDDLSRFDAQVLLGRDLLSRSVFVYDGPAGRFAFAF